MKKPSPRPFDGWSSAGCLAAALLLSLCVAAPASGQAAWTEADSLALVEDVRRPPIQDCWSIMTGKAKHSGPSAGKTLVLPIQVRARFSPNRSLAQLVFNDRERYLIGQNFADGILGTSVIQQQIAPPGVTSLNDIGVRPSDITLSFLYWNYEQDLGADDYKSLDCRVLQFRHPDQEERVRVWVSLKHRFPMLVKWYQGTDEEPYRQLDLKDLKQVNGVYMISRVVISNPGWKTEIRFNDIKLEPLKPGDVVPADLFLAE